MEFEEMPMGSVINVNTGVPIVRAESTLESACGHVRLHRTKCCTCDFPELCFLFSTQPFHLTSKKNDNKILPFIINVLITRLPHLSSM